MNQNGRGYPLSPIGGAPGRRESQGKGQPPGTPSMNNNEILDSSGITDKNKYRGSMQPLNMLQNVQASTVASRASAL
jgi:hypothetical protein